MTHVKVSPPALSLLVIIIDLNRVVNIMQLYTAEGSFMSVCDSYPPPRVLAVKKFIGVCL
jgi:hypothetical protein